MGGAEFLGGVRSSVPRVRTAPAQAGNRHRARLQNADLLRLDELPIGKLRTDLAPYHLINTALNIEGSKHANRRGRSTPHSNVRTRFR